MVEVRLACFGSSCRTQSKPKPPRRLSACRQRNPDDGRDTFKTLKNQNIGDSCAYLYAEWATLEQSVGNVSKAIGIVQKGMKAGAQPAAVLDRLASEMQSGTWALGQGATDTLSLRPQAPLLDSGAKVCLDDHEPLLGNPFFSAELCCQHTCLFSSHFGMAPAAYNYLTSNLCLTCSRWTRQLPIQPAAPQLPTMGLLLPTAAPAAAMRRPRLSTGTPPCPRARSVEAPSAPGRTPFPAGMAGSAPFAIVNIIADLVCNISAFVCLDLIAYTSVNYTLLQARHHDSTAGPCA